MRFALISFCLSALTVFFNPALAEDEDAAASPLSMDSLVGFWTGAIVKSGSALLVEVTIERAPNGALQAETHFPDWLWHDPRLKESVERSGNQVIIADFYEADAVLQYDSTHRQMIGRIGDETSGLSLHLKRAPSPPKEEITIQDVSFSSSDGTRLAGTLALPAGENLAAMVLVHGRGCSRRAAGQARLFARYGIAVLAYDKRGAGESEGDCATSNFSELADDAQAAMRFLADHKSIDSKHIGLKGDSAGAWTIQAVAKRAMKSRRALSPAFLVTWIGPATSIRQQQISSAYTYGAANGLNQEQQQLAVEAVTIITDLSLTDDQAYERLAEIRDQAASEGWKDVMFGSDDLPAARDEMDGLWLRRFRFDPTEVLSNLDDTPYLGVFGKADTIVPHAENIEALKQAALSGGDFTIISIANVGHTTEHGDRLVTLPNGETYWKHDTVEPGFAEATVAFLRNHGFARN